MKKYTIVVFLLASFLSFSQEKYEKEYRIKPDQAPKNAVKFINELNFKKKIKWYAEESNDGKTFEAKTCHLKHLFSVEFTKEGYLIDVEKKVSFSDLNKVIQQNINNSLSKKFVKFRIKKVQQQFKGQKNDLKKIFLNSFKTDGKQEVFYEIIVKGKENDTYKLYEVLLDAEGNISKILTFRAINSLNLEF
jgi:hypothetical protein